MNCSFKSLLAAVLLLCSTVATAHDFEVGGIFYNITSSTEKTVSVTYKGDYYNTYYGEYTGDVTVPSTVAYNGNTYSVASIGELAFHGCSGLTSIGIPGSVTSIGDGAFYDCDGLTSIEIPGSVTSIGAYAFEDCVGLTSIEIPGSVTSIGDFAFLYCSGLKSVTSLATTAPALGSYAFSYISSGATLYYPAGSDYSRWARYFANTEEIAVQSGSCGDNARWSLENGVLTISGTGAMWDYYLGNSLPWPLDEITHVIIEDGVTSIGNRAFYDCSGLKIVTIGDGVTSIGDWAFSNCNSLTSVTIGDGVTSIGGWAFRDCDGLTSIEIPGSVTSVGDYAFYDCDGLTSVTIGDGVTSIGEFAFSNCNSLMSVTIGDGVTSIGKYAFSGCDGLTSIEIPGSVKSIGGSAFADCYRLTSIEIPGSVTSIGEYAFSSCSGLTSIVVAEENTIYDSRNNCNAIIETATNILIQGCQNTIIPGSVTSIGEYAFFNCSGLTSIEIPGSVTSIGDYAFYDCDGLTSIEIPGSVISIGGWAFHKCYCLTSVTSLATTAPALGSVVFSYISSNATLYYPAGSDYSSWAQYFANTEEFEIAEPSVNTIEVTSANMLAGTQALLSFNLKNEDTISGFQFDLHLPNGFAIAKDEMGDEIVYINEERISPRTHSFNTSVNNDGSQLVLVYSQSGAQVRGNEGEVISILVDVAADVAPGNYTVELRDLELVTPEAKTYDIPQSAYTLKVCAPCDANGDGTVSVSDIQMIVNMILNDSDPLENPAANANGDGKISVSDIQVVVNRILGKY